MVAHIAFLGTGGDSIVVGKNIRSAGGIIIRFENCQFHIDPGPGSLIKAQNCGMNLRENTCVLCTHEHVNHASDLNAVIGAMTLNGFDHRGVLIMPEKTVHTALSKFHQNCVERIIIAEPKKRIGIENVEIQVLPAIHDTDAVGYKLFTPEFVLSYTGDTQYDKDALEFYKGTDILILNCAYPFESKGRTALNSEDVVKILKKVKPRLAIITHFGNKMMQANPIYEAREIQKQTDIQVIAAEDGMIINPMVYSADSKQKILSAFDVEKYGITENTSEVDKKTN